MLSPLAALLLAVAAAAAPLSLHDSHVAGRTAHGEGPGGPAGSGAERLPLPTPQELQAIRKVAQILVMLGEQVIPAILGEQRAADCEPPAPPPAPPLAPPIAPPVAPLDNSSVR